MIREIKEITVELIEKDGFTEIKTTSAGKLTELNYIQAAMAVVAEASKETKRTVRDILDEITRYAKYAEFEPADPIKDFASAVVRTVEND